MDIVEGLRKLDCGKVIANPSMKNYTTFKVGGEALAMIYPANVEQLKKIILFLRENGVSYKVLGNGSNVIFRESGYSGVIIKLDLFQYLEINGNVVKVGAGYSLVKLSMKTARLGLTGLEFAAGIPATIGGAIFMNAGAYKSDMGYVVHSVTVLTPELEVKTLSNKEMDFHYRSSFLQKNPDYICLGVTLHLIYGKRELILDVIKDRKRRRLESQPLEYPSAGSVFRNPSNDYAGRIIEAIGYKGKRLGGAMVSDKHANFIINVLNATGDEVIDLILEIQKKIKEEIGIELKIEQEFVE